MPFETAQREGGVREQAPLLGFVSSQVHSVAYLGA